MVQALAEQAGVADAGAANRLIAECRSVCSDATSAEIIDIIQEKAFAARCRRDVRNLIGFLLSTVPPVFDGQGIVSHRLRRAAEAKAAKRKIEEERKLEESRRDYYAREAKRLTVLLSNQDLPMKRREQLELEIRACERVASEEPEMLAEGPE